MNTNEPPRVTLSTGVPAGRYLNDLASAIFWGGATVEEAGVAGAALGIAQPPRQIWVALEVGVVGDRDSGWVSWWKGGEGMETRHEPSPATRRAYPTHPSAQEAPLTARLRKAEEGSMVQGVHEDTAHNWVQSGLLGLGAPQPCQETCADPTAPQLVLASAWGSPSPP